MEGITHQYIVDYINMVQPAWDKELEEIKAYGHENNVPIIQDEAAKFLYVLALLKSPEKILEIGTAIGYSAAILSKTLKENGKIVTLERDKEMYDIAVKNINNLKLENKVNIIFGEALTSLKELDDKFDIIFIDAGKGHYKEFFDNSVTMLKENGIIICDNVLFKGMIASDELATKKSKTIVNRMRDFIKTITEDNRFETSIVPIGDGVMISVKR